VAAIVAIAPFIAKTSPPEFACELGPGRQSMRPQNRIYCWEGY